MCSCDTAEPPSFFDWNRVRARRAHKCCECPFPIVAGETYVRSVGKWDGDLRTYKRHAECDSAAQVEDGCHAAFGHVHEDLRECDLARGHPARRAWGRLIWRFRKHPEAPRWRLREVLDDVEWWCDVIDGRRATAQEASHAVL